MLPVPLPYYYFNVIIFFRAQESSLPPWESYVTLSLYPPEIKNVRYNGSSVERSFIADHLSSWWITSHDQGRIHRSESSLTRNSAVSRMILLYEIVCWWEHTNKNNKKKHNNVCSLKEKSINRLTAVILWLNLILYTIKWIELINICNSKYSKDMLGSIISWKELEMRTEYIFYSLQKRWKEK